MSDEMTAHDPFESGSPPLEFVSMPEEKRDEETTFGGDESGLRAAADELSKQRAAEEPIVERSYLRDGEPVPDNETITIDRAANDLNQARQAEAKAAQDEANKRLADEVDILRNGEVQQAAEEVEAEPEAPKEEPKHVNEKLAQALQDPEIRQAWETEYAAVDQARQQFMQATNDIAGLVHADFLQKHPEIAKALSLRTEQERIAALTAVQQSNPAALAEYQAHAQKLHTLANAKMQAQQQQAQIEQARFKQFAAEQDAEFVKAILNEPPDTVKAVREALPKIAKEVYGVQPEELRQLLETPLFRTAAAQRMMFDAVKYHVQQQALETKKVRNVPPVHRPGVSQPRLSGAERDAEAIRKAFIKNPTPQSGAAYLMAQRAARGS